jgi:release factor glutamine methyltransferase
MNNRQVIMIGREELKKHKKNEDFAKQLYKGLFEGKEEISLDELKIYKEKLKRIVAGEPLQYVIGNVNFYGYKFNINNNVLIPRFETEELVSHTIKYIKNYFKDPITILDIGTGSGVIAITLKKEFPCSCVIATDISLQAIEVAKENAKILDADINFVIGDMLKPVEGQKVDVLISNPPYIKEIEEIEKIVFDYEPHIALYAGKDGLKYYKEILMSASNILNDKFIIALEISDLVKDGVLKLVNKYFNNITYKIIKDMGGRNRMLFIFSKID